MCIIYVKFISSEYNNTFKDGMIGDVSDSSCTESVSNIPLSKPKKQLLRRYKIFYLGKNDFIKAII